MIFFEISAVRMSVCAYMDATLLTEMLRVLPPTSKVSNLKISNNCSLDKAIYRLQKPVILPNIYFLLKQIK